MIAFKVVIVFFGLMSISMILGLSDYKTISKIGDRLVGPFGVLLILSIVIAVVLI